MRRMLFEPYIRSGGKFANRLGKWRGNPWHRKRMRRRRTYWSSLYANRINKDIQSESRLAAARKLLSCNPLYVHLMAVEDAVTPRYRPIGSGQIRD